MMPLAEAGQNSAQQVIEEPPVVLSRRHFLVSFQPIQHQEQRNLLGKVEYPDCQAACRSRIVAQSLFRPGEQFTGPLFSGSVFVKAPPEHTANRALLTLAVHPLSHQGCLPGSAPGGNADQADFRVCCPAVQAGQFVLSAGEEIYRHPAVNPAHCQGTATAGGTITVPLRPSIGRKATSPAGLGNVSSGSGKLRLRKISQ